jgi:glutathione S-transferase
MKLYYAPGACSLAPHIVAREAGIELELDKVDIRKGLTADGADFTAINPKGYVPALELDDGQLLTEGPAISQYLADQAPSTGLAPANGSIARYQLQALLGYINSELHKSYSPLFNPATGAETRAERIAYIQRRYGLIEQQLETGPYLDGEQFSIADAYLFVVTRWARPLRLDLSAFPNLAAFQARVAARPAVQAALRAEGLPAA